MEGRSRVRRHEITKNGIDVEIRDPYRYRSVPLSFDRYIAKSARKTSFFHMGERQSERKKLQRFSEIAALGTVSYGSSILCHINGTFLKQYILLPYFKSDTYN